MAGFVDGIYLEGVTILNFDDYVLKNRIGHGGIVTIIIQFVADDIGHRIRNCISSRE